ncbi:MAG: nucleoside-triphosphatase, partial [Solirubrobacteraceae bacterium]
MAVPAMEAAAEGEVAMIDELGKMELASRRFREAVSALLERPVPVVATMQSAWHPFTDTLKRRSGIETLRLPARIATTLRRRWRTACGAPDEAPLPPAPREVELEGHRP